MADTVELPAVGPVDKKWVMLGGAAVVGVIVYAWWTAGQAPAEEVPPIDVGDTGIPTDGYVNPAPGGSSTSGGEVDPETLPPTTADAWMRRAVAALEGIGYDPANVAMILGRYLGRQTVTTQQADVIRMALAFVGPVPGGTYSILLEPTPATTPSRPPTTGGGEKTPPTPTPTTPPPSGGVPPYHTYITRSGDTLSTIAARYGKRWEDVWDFNLRYRSAATRAILLQRGPHRLVSGSTFWIPK